MVNVNKVLVVRVGNVQTAALTSVVMLFSDGPAYILPVFGVTEDVNFNIGFGFCILGVFKDVHKVGGCHCRKCLLRHFETISTERKRVDLFILHTIVHIMHPDGVGVGATILWDRTCGIHKCLYRLAFTNMEARLSIKFEVVIALVKKDLPSYSVGINKNAVIGKLQSTAAEFFEGNIGNVDGFITLGLFDLVSH